MNNFCNNIIFFIPVQVIVIALLLLSSSSEPIKGHHDDINSLVPYFKTWHVHTINGLSNGKILLVHCKSKDNDLAILNLTLSVTGRTLFWCYMTYDNFHAALNVFWDNPIFFNKCNNGDCIWIAKDDGIYFRNFATKVDELRQTWGQGPL
ncbi:hypothetical protein ES332_A08G226700v1 [Gossypium tomentosum]|uniref:S-protein homolog n=1 Tax=Gossypium tomentosum TaxID=34277 RepID=A0A5D2PJ02_GOSTO|nr:hypothetical protein ES332_A08G226700v1 [Gossypium tomentosum]